MEISMHWTIVVNNVIKSIITINKIIYTIKIFSSFLKKNFIKKVSFIFYFLFKTK